MFPPIKVELQNLNPNSFYVLLMDLVPVDKYRYKYQNSNWVKCFEEACAPTRLYIHPDSPALGSFWTDHIISFYKLKLTNNQLDKQGHIIVNSMHCYQPRLHIVESSDRHNLNWEDFHTIIFPGTQFTTVTAYQNDKITQLKIENNPFAKGFRQPMSRNRTRPIKLSYPPQSGSETGSDDGVVYNSVPIVSPSQETIRLSNEDRRISLKRKSSASDDEASLKKLRGSTQFEDYNKIRQRLTPPLISAAPHPLTTSPPLLPPTPPFYVVYNNGTDTVSSTASPLLTSHTPHQAVYPAHTGPSVVPTFQIVQLNPTPTTNASHHHHQGSITIPQSAPMLLPSSSYVKPASHTSSDSSDSDSDNEGSPQNSPCSTVIQPPPPLISTPRVSATGLQNILMIPQQPRQIFTSPSPPPHLSPASSLDLIKHRSHVNGIHAHQTTQGQQQILVPVTALSTISGKSSLLLQPLVTPGPTNTLMQLNTGSVPHPSVSGDGSVQYVRSVPFIVSAAGVSKGAGLSPFAAASAATGGQALQMLKIESGRVVTPPHQIVDEAH